MPPIISFQNPFNNLLCLLRHPPTSTLIQHALQIGAGYVNRCNSTLRIACCKSYNCIQRLFSAHSKSLILRSEHLQKSKRSEGSFTRISVLDHCLLAALACTINTTYENTGRDYRFAVLQLNTKLSTGCDVADHTIRIQGVQSV